MECCLLWFDSVIIPRGLSYFLRSTLYNGVSTRGDIHVLGVCLPAQQSPNHTCASLFSAAAHGTYHTGCTINLCIFNARQKVKCALGPVIIENVIGLLTTVVFCDTLYGMGLFFKRKYEADEGWMICQNWSPKRRGEASSCLLGLSQREEEEVVSLHVVGEVTHSTLLRSN